MCSAQKTDSYGAMTFCFISAVLSDECRTYNELLSTMNKFLRTGNVGAGAGRDPVAELLAHGSYLNRPRVKSRGLTFQQIPQLSADKEFDVHTALRWH